MDELQDLQFRLARLEDAMRGIPSRWATVAATPVYSITACAGNTLATLYGVAITGIKTGTITAIPTATPTAGTYADGLGYGTLDGTLVWVINNNYSAFVPSTVTVFSISQTTLPCTAGGTTTAYVIAGI